jgi:hypothetical protein
MTGIIIYERAIEGHDGFGIALGDVEDKREVVRAGVADQLVGLLIFPARVEQRGFGAARSASERDRANGS